MNSVKYNKGGSLRSHRSPCPWSHLMVITGWRREVILLDEAKPHPGAVAKANSNS